MVKALMAKADIFVFPTRADTYPLPAVEAMAHGCAVIVSDLQPLPEVIPNGEGRVVVPADDPYALAAKLNALITAPETGISIQRATEVRHV
jgi:glycosyltransferase involved in cell wall biosynthesis